MHKFDRDELLVRLNRLDHQRRTAFAVTCAQRLFPAYELFCKRTNRGHPGDVRKGIQEVWRSLTGTGKGTRDLNKMAQRCEELVPDEEDKFDVMLPYAANAATAATFALWCAAEGDSENAAWAAYQGYEAVDFYTHNALNIDFNEKDAQVRILEGPAVQTELERQLRDLADLESAKGKGPFRAVVDRIRRRSQREGKTYPFLKH